MIPRDTFRRKPDSKRGGFTLLMTVAVLSISVLVMTSVAAHSSNLVFQSKIKLKQLRSRWAEATSQRVFLKNPRHILTKFEGEDRIEESARVFRFQLNKQPISVLVSDDNAKLDLNLISSRVSDFQLKSVVRDLGDGTLPVYLRPLAAKDRRTSREDRFGCWEQIWDASGQDCDEFEASSTNITLWGNQLNLLKAEPQIIEEVGKPFLGKIVTGKLIRLLEDVESNQVNLDNLLSTLDLNQKQTQLCKRLFTTRSYSFSLWYNGPCKGNGRKSLLVKEGLPVNHFRSILTRHHYFSW